MTHLKSPLGIFIALLVIIIGLSFIAFNRLQTEDTKTENTKESPNTDKVTIEGTLHNPDGSPVAGKWIHILRSKKDDKGNRLMVMSIDEKGHIINGGKSDDKGYFEIEVDRAFLISGPIVICWQSSTGLVPVSYNGVSAFFDDINLLTQTKRIKLTTK